MRVKSEKVRTDSASSANHHHASEQPTLHPSIFLAKSGV